MFVKTLLFVFMVNKINSNPIVQLPDGQISGRENTTAQNTNFYVFEKIPYAAPPIGNLRFKAPVPPKRWSGVLNTTHLDAICYQNFTDSDLESEDCLYLNVYTPQLPSKHHKVPLPVMLFIHGGDFLDGHSTLYGPDKFIDSGVILVTINYRLGIFGFLSTEDHVIPGNYGLKDQYLAIKWTHDNIKLFGGDPNKITIFGESSGSASVAFHISNQKSNGLFQAAICQSGSHISSWAYQRKAREIAFNTTASYFNNTLIKNDSVALLAFLQNVSAKELDKAGVFRYSDGGPRKWAPVIECNNPDAVVTEKMYESLRDGKVVNVTLLIGQNSEESLLFYPDADLLIEEMEFYDKNLDALVPDNMRITNLERKKQMGELIRRIYTGGEPFSDHIGDGARYISDNLFSRSIIKHAELYSKFAKTYFYMFSYDGILGNISIHYDGAENVGHYEEIHYLFCTGKDCDFQSYPESDRLTSQRLVKIWTNFAKYHNPTPQPQKLLQNITWPLVSVKNGDFLYVDIDENLKIKNHPKEFVYKEWVKLYDSLGYDDFDTY